MNDFARIKVQDKSSVVMMDTQYKKLTSVSFLYT